MLGAGKRVSVARRIAEEGFMSRGVIAGGLAPVAGVWVLLACARADDPPGPKKPGPAGTWTIKGTDMDETEWTGKLVLRRDKGALVGYINWSARGGKADGASGREYVRATYDPKTRLLKMTGERLQDANMIALGTYQAELSEDGSRLEKGGWSDAGSGKWTAARRTRKPAPPDAPVETGFVERTYTGPRGGEFKYVVFVPHGYKKGGDKTYPVIVFLHGFGEGGTDGWAPTKYGIGPAIEDNEKKFPFLVVFPQARSGWYTGAADERRAVAILDDVLKSYRGDPKRVYLTGWSLGGLGAWDLAVAYPERWAAVVPVCPGAATPDTSEAAKAKDIPFWLFHGEQDDAAPIKNSRRIVKALEAAGGTARFDIDPDAGHTYDYVNGVYANEDLYKWLLEQRRE
jgi:pimeloyl-ACP methyl ester carboxylesterase